jgi:hypothetical protein
MSLSPLIFWAVGFLVISLIGLYIATKTVKINLEWNGELIIAMLTILGTLVSILLGLLVSSADDQYRSMEAFVNAEATSVAEVFRLSRGLPPPTSTLLQQCCIDYCDKTVASEWPAMKHGEISQEVNQVFVQLSDAVVNFHPANDGQAAVQGGLIAATSSMEQNRSQRIVSMRSTWTRRLLPLIFTCAFVVLACSYLYVGKGSLRVHAVLVGLVAVTLGTNIGVIFLMTRPFSSEWAIQPEGFELNARALRRYVISQGKTDTQAQAPASRP